MKEYDLEDLSIILSCALDGMKIICGSFKTGDNEDNIRVQDALHSVYVHLRCISDEIENRIEAIPEEFVRRRVANT